jgi:flagellar motility protein MotE (MotC chaperone)
LRIDENEAANLKATAGIYDKMSSEQAAAILSQMFAGGQQDSVVKIISLMQDRSAAKTLESLTDAKIGAQITEQLQRIAKPTKAGG